MTYSGEADIVSKAKALLAGGTLDGSLFPANLTINKPLPVVNPAGSGLHSWWVPLTAGKKLVAFFQFLQQGTLMRSSSFKRNKDNDEGCPEAKDWLDESRILQLAQEKAGKDERLQQPYLTYDISPDRLVWAVPGKERIIYVAGGYAYEK